MESHGPSDAAWLHTNQVVQWRLAGQIETPLVWIWPQIFSQPLPHPNLRFDAPIIGQLRLPHTGALQDGPGGSHTSQSSGSTRPAPSCAVTHLNGICDRDFRAAVVCDQRHDVWHELTTLLQPIVGREVVDAHLEQNGAIRAGGENKW